ncbi:MAG: hypothetical protein J6Y17_03330 [Elusimicrobiaceae bacterium]|nr:hypothetical protein [Elusimicrobiaceae bacterium]
MSISSLICKRTYHADGERREWEIDFPVLSAQDVVIYVTDPQGAESKITDNYEVNLEREVVVYPLISSGVSPLATGYTITLLRTTPYTQGINLTQQGTLDAEELEAGFDRLTLQIQELAEQLKRSIKYAVSSINTDVDAQTFLNELQATQTAALNTALASVEQTKTTLQQALATEQTQRSQADLSLQQNLQMLAGTAAQQEAAQTSALSSEASTRSVADTALESALSAETTARLNGDAALQQAIEQLNFITFVVGLPASGNSKYIYAVPQEETDLDDHPIVVLYLWDTTLQSWNAIGAFSTNLDPATLLTKTEAANTYLTQTAAVNTYLPLAQKAVAGGVASLDANGKLASTQIPYATSNTIGGIKQSFDSTTGTWIVVTEDL